MYLLDTSEFTLHYFSEPNIPDYAILSHRWNAVEISFADIHSNKNIQDAAAFSKIRGFCDQSRLDGWKYVWIDSCCIDKSSSSELSEAINSMFSWYAKAQVCYAYLGDVFAGGSNIRGSLWFTRGWTLQELLAPEFVTFYSRDWKELGTKRSLKDLISAITGIRSEYLIGSASVLEASIAERMSWASRRVTSRSEDVAYCLLGIFGVNIPPLYGEGLNAFVRLQLEIMRTTIDETLFAWTTDTGEETMYGGGLLANSPAAFKYSGNIQPSLFDPDRPPYQMTNKGLHINPILFSPGIDVEDYMEDDHIIMILNCSRNDSDHYLAILLRRLQGGHFLRIKPENLPAWDREMGRKLGREDVYVKQPIVVQKGLHHDFCTVSVDLYPASSTGCWAHVATFTSASVDGNPYKSSNQLANITVERGIHGHMYLVIKTKYRSGGHREDACLLINLGEKPLGANFLTHISDYFGKTRAGDYYDVDTNSLIMALRKCNFDRLSRPLPSGASISMTFRRGVSRVGGNGGPHYIVRIMGDETGSLPWPGTNEHNTTDQESSS